MHKNLIDRGLLWFDDDPKLDLFTKIERGAKYFQEKYKKKANFCLVNPAMLKDEIGNSDQIEVRVNPIILPHHFWIGIKDVSKDG